MATAWRPIPVCNCLFIIYSILFTKLPIHLCLPFKPGTMIAENLKNNATKVYAKVPGQCS